MSSPPAPLRVALVETSDAFPGLLPFQSWDVLGTAEVVLLRDVDSHPSAPHLHLAGLDLDTIEPARLDRADMDLTRPGGADDRRIAKALVERAASGQDAVYLLGPEDTGLAPALAGMAAEHDVEIELVLLAQQPPGSELLRLVQVMAQLRDPETGCPWDLEQDHASLVRYLVEESYELVDAIEREDDVDLQEELGDVLLQIVFHARIAADRRAFGIDDVARDIADKLVRRHPHVFADGDAATPAEVQSNWDQLKAEEKSRTGPFDGVPASGPGLHLLGEIQRKTSALGFDRRSLDRINSRRGASDRGDPGDVAAQVHADVDAILAARDPAEVEARVGSLVARVVSLAHDLDVDPERAARGAARALRDRVESMVQLAADRDVEVADLDDAGWQELWQATSRTDPPGPPVTSPAPE